MFALLQGAFGPLGTGGRYESRFVSVNPVLVRTGENTVLMDTDRSK